MTREAEGEIGANDSFRRALRRLDSGFVLTTLLGIAGAFVATFLGQAIGWYHAGEGAGFIGAVVGAVIVLVIWGVFASRTARA